MSLGVLASLLYCGAAFGGAFLFMRIAAPELPPLVVAFGRVAIAALILLPIAGRGRLAAMRPYWRQYAVVGFFMAAAPFALFAFAERSLTAGMGSIINATTPLWTALILAVWVRQVPTPRRIAAIVVGFAGVGVIVGFEGVKFGPGVPLAVLAATAGAASYGLALTFIRRRMAPQSPLTLALGQLIAATILLAPLALPASRSATPGSASVVALLGLGLLSTAIAWPILFRLNREVGPMAASTVTFLNPVFGTLWGALFLGEVVSPTFLLGAALVFVSLLLVLDVRLPAALGSWARSRPATTARAKADE